MSSWTIRTATLSDLGWESDAAGCAAQLLGEIDSSQAVVVIVASGDTASELFVNEERILQFACNLARSLYDLGVRSFILDLRGVDLYFVYPIMKWCGIHGILAKIRRDLGDTVGVNERMMHLKRMVKCVVPGGTATEPCRLMRFDEIFEFFADLESAIRSFGRSN